MYTPNLKNTLFDAYKLLFYQTFFTLKFKVNSICSKIAVFFTGRKIRIGQDSQILRFSLSEIGDGYA